MKKLQREIIFEEKAFLVSFPEPVDKYEVEQHQGDFISRYPESNR